MQQAGETTGGTTQSTTTAVKSRPSARKEPAAAPEAALDAGHSLLEEAPLAPSTFEPTPAAEQSEAGLDDAMVEVEVEVEGVPLERDETGEPDSTGPDAQMASADQVERVSGPPRPTVTQRNWCP